METESGIETCKCAQPGFSLEEFTTENRESGIKIAAKNAWKKNISVRSSLE